MESRQLLQMRPESGLCDRCGDMALETIRSHEYAFSSDFESLIISSASCGMCRLVKKRLHTVIKQYIRRGQRDCKTMVSLLPHEVPGKLWVRAIGLKLGELQFYAHPDKFATKLNLPMAFPDADHVTLPLLVETLENCIYNRGHCAVSDGSQMPLAPLLPRRVIDVGDSIGNKFQSSVRLYESSMDERACYVALSHRWGNAIPSKTTRAKLDTYTQSIPYDSLPNTFKDAVVTTRKMGIKYLWIDALCIVQDDHDDWASQAPRMGAIFQNASCTIAAHSAEHSEYGFLSSVQGTDMVEVGLGGLRETTGEGQGTTMDRIYLDLPRSFDGIISRSHIMQRGWIQQELILSRRLIHFYRGLAYWECHHTTDPKPLGFTAELHTARYWQIKRKRSVRRDAEHSWMEFVSHYSACELTYESDRLVAIEGIATEWKDRLGTAIAEHYRYGHFLRDAGNLLWITTNEAAKKRKEFPSWSWASIEGPVQFMHDKSNGSGPRIKVNACIPAQIRSRKPSQLVIRAQTARVLVDQCVDRDDILRWNVYLGNSIKGVSLRTPYGTACFDCPPEGIRPRHNGNEGGCHNGFEFRCVRIVTFTDREDCDVSAFGILLLKTIDLESSIFERVGVGMIYSASWFDGEAYKTLHIQ